jgi:hypothetical protein
MPEWITDELYLWTKSALECEDWIWDEDQREAAQEAINAYEMHKKEVC